MDFVNKLTGGNNQGQGQASSEQSQSTGSSGQQQGSGGFLGGIGDKLNSAAGGGRESEKNEDYVDKGKILRRSCSTVIWTLMHRRRRLCAREVPWTRPARQRGMLSLQPDNVLHMLITRSLL